MNSWVRRSFSGSVCRASFWSLSSPQRRLFGRDSLFADNTSTSCFMTGFCGVPGSCRLGRCNVVGSLQRNRTTWARVGGPLAVDGSYFTSRIRCQSA